MVEKDYVINTILLGMNNILANPILLVHNPALSTKTLRNKQNRKANPS